MLIVQHVCTFTFNTQELQGMSAGFVNRKILAARWLVPVSAEPIADGAVLVEGAFIKAVGERNTICKLAPDAELVDFGAAILTPGLINLHTHLDYTYLRHVDTDSSMFGWLRALVSGSRQFHESDWLQSALQGAAEVATSGTTLIADCSYRGAAAEAAALVGLRAVVGLELFGIDREREEQIWQEWLTKLSALETRLSGTRKQAGLCQEGDGRVTLTVSPHAPYTVSPPLWRRALQWAQAAELPVLCHLAESRAECDFLSGGGDDIVGYLSWVYGRDASEIADITSWRQAGAAASPVEYARRHQLLGSNLVCAHAVQMAPGDIDTLAAAQVGVAHCPRSNARLRNGFAPVSAFLEAGVKFGFGTDSAASAPDLSVLHDARFSLHALRLFDSEHGLASESFFRHLTLGAARVLGMDHQVGSLEVGKVADLAVFAIDQLITHGAREKPYEMLMHGGVRVTDVFVDGESIVKGGAVVRSLPAPDNFRENAVASAST